MTNPLKHKNEIIAWANGAQIQIKRIACDDWVDISVPSWQPESQYRVKPEPRIVKRYTSCRFIEDAFDKGTLVSHVQAINFWSAPEPGMLEWVFTNGKVTSVRKVKYD